MINTLMDVFKLTATVMDTIICKMLLMHVVTSKDVEVLYIQALKIKKEHMI